MSVSCIPVWSRRRGIVCDRLSNGVNCTVWACGGNLHQRAGKVLMVDASELVRYGTHWSGGGARSDIFNPSVSGFLLDLVRAFASRSAQPQIRRGGCAPSQARTPLVSTRDPRPATRTGERRGRSPYQPRCSCSSRFAWSASYASLLGFITSLRSSLDDRPSELPPRSSPAPPLPSRCWSMAPLRCAVSEKVARCAWSTNRAGIASRALTRCSALRGAASASLMDRGSNRATSCTP